WRLGLNPGIRLPSTVDRSWLTDSCCCSATLSMVVTVLGMALTGFSVREAVITISSKRDSSVGVWARAVRLHRVNEVRGRSVRRSVRVIQTSELQIGLKMI